MSLARDVGPSAGYFGCLGLVSSWLPGRWRWISGALILGGLVAVLFLPPRAGESELVKLGADLAHLMTFPLGWVAYRYKSVLASLAESAHSQLRIKKLLAQMRIMQNDLVLYPEYPVHPCSIKEGRCR